MNKAAIICVGLVLAGCSSTPAGGPKARETLGECKLSPPENNACEKER